MALPVPQDQTPVPHDVTILYMDDAREWCEYLFDIFHPYNIYLNAEDITVFPTVSTTLEGIRTSNVHVLIISPTFLEKCSSEIEELVKGRLILGLLCGVQLQELDALDLPVPCHKEWKLVNADDDPMHLTQKTMRLLDDAMKIKYTTAEAALMAEANTTGPTDIYEDMVGRVGEQENVHPEDDEQIYVQNEVQASDIYTMYDAMTVVPERIRAHEKFFIIFPSDTLEDTKSYLVSISGPSHESHVEATVINPYVLAVAPPKDHPSESVNLEIICDGHSKHSCRVRIVTALDELAENIKKSVEPLDVICQSLGISPTNSNELDNILFEHMKQFQDSKTLQMALLTDQKVLQDRSDKLYPTALHFAANFGLKTVTSFLLNLPGADHACRVKNSANLSPSGMAKKNGHSDLCAVINLQPIPTEQVLPGYMKMTKEKQHSYPGYMKMTKDPHYVRPVGTLTAQDKDAQLEMVKQTVNEGGDIYDLFYARCTRDPDPDEVEDQVEHPDYEYLPDNKIDGPALPDKVVIPSLPLHKRLPSQTSEELPVPELPDPNRELLSINDRLKSGEIDGAAAMTEFEMWRKRYKEPPMKEKENKMLPHKHVQKKKKEKKNKKRMASVVSEPISTDLIPQQNRSMAEDKTEEDQSTANVKNGVGQRNVNRRSYLQLADDIHVGQPMRPPPPVPQGASPPDRPAPPPPTVKPPGSPYRGPPVAPKRPIPAPRK